MKLIEGIWYDDEGNIIIEDAEVQDILNEYSCDEYING